MSVRSLTDMQLSLFALNGVIDKTETELEQVKKHGDFFNGHSTVWRLSTKLAALKQQRQTLREEIERHQLSGDYRPCNAEQATLLV